MKLSLKRERLLIALTAERILLVSELRGWIRCLHVTLEDHRQRGEKLLREVRRFPATVGVVHPQLRLPDYILTDTRLSSLQTGSDERLRECDCTLDRLRKLATLRGEVLGLMTLTRGQGRMDPTLLRDSILAFIRAKWLGEPRAGERLMVKCDPFEENPLNCDRCRAEHRPPKDTPGEWSSSCERLRRCLMKGHPPLCKASDAFRFISRILQRRIGQKQCLHCEYATAWNRLFCCHECGEGGGHSQGCTQRPVSWPYEKRYEGYIFEHDGR